MEKRPLDTRSTPYRLSVPWLLALPAFLAVITLAIVPSSQLLLQSLRPAEIGAGLSLANFQALLASRIGRQAALRTVRISVIVTLLCIVAAYPMALFLSRSLSRLRPVWLAIVVFPLLVSVVVRAYGWTVVLGRNGLLNSLLLSLGAIAQPLSLVFNETGIIIGEVHLLLPYMILSLLAVMQKTDPNLMEAAQSLGARPIVVFWRVVFPMSLPGLLTGTLLVFSLAMTAFATPFVLGGGRAPLLTTLMYDYAFTVYDWSRAATVGVVLLLFGLAFVSLHRMASRQGLRGIE